MKDRTGSAGRGTGKRPGRPRAEAGGGDAATNAPRLRNNPLAWVTAAVTGPDAAPAAASAADTAEVGLSPATPPDAPPSPATATMTKRERRSPARATAMDQSKKRTEDMPTPRKTEAPPAGASDTLTAADFAAYERLTTSIILTDRQGRITFANRAARTLVGGMADDISFATDGAFDAVEMIGQDAALLIGEAREADGISRKRGDDGSLQIPFGDSNLGLRLNTLGDEGALLLEIWDATPEVKSSEQVTLLLSELSALADAQAQGQTSRQIDVTGLVGESRIAAEKINKMTTWWVSNAIVVTSFLQALGDRNFAVSPPAFKGDMSMLSDAMTEARQNLMAANESSEKAAAAMSKLISDMNEMADAHARGDIDIYVDPLRHEGPLRDIAERLNNMVQEQVATKTMAIRVVSEFGRGNFDAPMPALPRKKAFVSDAIEQVRANFIAVTDEIARLSHAIVEGRLDLEPATDRFGGAFATIIGHFVDAYASLNDSFSRIGDQVGQVSQAVEQVTRSSQSLATNAAIQSSSVDEVSASTEETDSQVKANAKTATATSDLVASTAVVAAEGRDKIAQMVQAMDGIRSSSEDIAKIIKVIDEIAFQTNLLALNAAVEAARAGQHGRGFAVVAHEVRNLAGRSAKAARETSDLIDGASQRVTTGVRIARETADAFERISGDIDRVKSLVGDIARSSGEQSRGVAQINLALGEIAKSAIATSQQAEELAAGADQMLSATMSMREAVGRFHLRAPKAPDPVPPALTDLPPALMAQIQALIASQMAQPGRPVANGHASAFHNDHDHRGFANF